jgi:hypothetical protein
VNERTLLAYWDILAWWLVGGSADFQLIKRFRIVFRSELSIVSLLPVVTTKRAAGEIGTFGLFFLCFLFPFRATSNAE